MTTSKHDRLSQDFEALSGLIRDLENSLEISEYEDERAALEGTIERYQAQLSEVEALMDREMEYASNDVGC